MTNSEIRDIADRVLASSLGASGLERIEVRVEHDEIDGPALLIDAYVKSDVGALGGGVTSSALHALSEALLEAGEHRFPYLRLRYPDEDSALGGPLGGH